MVTKKTMAPQYRWFSFDRPLHEFELHATEAEARAAAENALVYYRDCAAQEGWPEDDICVGYGKLTGLPIRVDVKTREEWEKEHDPEDDPFPSADFDEVYDLWLGPVPTEAEPKTEPESKKETPHGDSGV